MKKPRLTTGLFNKSKPTILTTAKMYGSVKVIFLAKKLKILVFQIIFLPSNYQNQKS